MNRKSSTSLTKQAYDALKERIMRLQLRPGEILMVQTLSRDMGLSRTPVREALVRLESDGFIEEADGKKFRVSELTLTDIIEIHEIREMIELHTVRSAAGNCSKEQLGELCEFTTLMESAVAANDHIAFFQQDMAFHARLVNYCGNRTLENLVFQLNEKIQRIRHLTTFVYHRLEDTIGEHEAIVNSIEKGDSERAAQAMKYHLDQVRNGVIKLFEDGTMNFFGGVNLEK
ncbi:MAG: GntR family transcriptional regulator [Desulfocapsaceae bacterium]